MRMLNAIRSYNFIAWLGSFVIGFMLLGTSIPAHTQTAQTSQFTQLAEMDATSDPAVEDSVDKRLEMDMIAMPDLVHALTKNLGQLHYLRTICFGKSDQTWREYAASMMDIEAPSDMEKRRELIGSFNDGFYDQQTRHSKCSENVSTEAAAIAENGRHLASMLGDPYRE